MCFRALAYFNGPKRTNFIFCFRLKDAFSAEEKSFCLFSENIRVRFVRSDSFFSTERMKKYAEIIQKIQVFPNFQPHIESGKNSYFLPGAHTFLKNPMCFSQYKRFSMEFQPENSAEFSIFLQGKYSSRIGTHFSFPLLL